MRKHTLENWLSIKRQFFIMASGSNRSGIKVGIDLG